MRELVAIDVPHATRVVDIVKRVWDDGDAALIVDQRLPHSAARALLHSLGTHRVHDGNEFTRVDIGAEPMLEGDALVVATSGTSGVSKGVVHTHTTLRAASLAASAAVDAGAAAHWLACLPLAHIGGFGVVARAWHTGARLTVLDSFDPDAAVSAGATHVSLVATALRRLDPMHFHRVILGGSRPPENLPANVTTTYGLTESCGGVVYDRKPITGVEVAVSADGEILLRGPMIMARYRGDSVIHPVDSAGWLHTNDIGSIENGELSVAGRRGDMIITGGENVWPDVVEQRLAAHPAVAECAVAGVADDEWGQVVTAWVVPTPGFEPTLDELRDHVAEALPRYAAPRRLVIAKELPRTNLGKVVRSALVPPNAN
jgi:O-succinylbenzoic acid--CoA ligase